MICIITSSTDVHADRVEDLLKERSIEVIRLNSDDISPHNFLSFQIPSITVFSYKSGKKIYDLDKVNAYWYRKPEIWSTNYHKITTKEGLSIDFKLQEIKQFYKSIMFEAERKKIFCVSPLSSIFKSRNKIHQLLHAQELGFKVPDTIITSLPSEIEEFLKNHSGKGVIKAIDVGHIRFGKSTKLYFTSPINTKILRRISKNTTFDHPVLVQEQISKKIELRITIIGQQVFARSIDSQRLKTSKFDWRMANMEKLPHVSFSLPDKIKRLCLALCKIYRLQFGAIDMALTPDNQYVFFEINPNGQYLWIENQTGLPLSESMAN